jgi:hypothetical protein
MFYNNLSNEESNNFEDNNKISENLFNSENNIELIIKNLYDEILYEEILNYSNNLFNEEIIINDDNLDDNLDDNVENLSNEYLDNSEKNKNIEEIIIEFQNFNNLEKIQEENYQKILNSNKKKIVIIFVIPKKLIKTKVLTFYKCWKKGYFLNNSEKKIPKNVKRIILKKI